MPAPSVMRVITAFGFGVVALGALHAYRYYRWVAYGEPLPG